MPGSRRAGHLAGSWRWTGGRVSSACRSSVPAPWPVCSPTAIWSTPWRPGTASRRPASAASCSVPRVVMRRFSPFPPGARPGPSGSSWSPSSPPTAAGPSVQALYVLFDGEDGSPAGAHRRDRADLPEDGLRLGARLPSPLARRRTDAAHGRRRRAGSPPGRRPPGRAALHRAGVALEPHDERGPRPSPARWGPRWSASWARRSPQADVVCTATMTTTPLIEGRWLRPGTHLDLVGAYLPDRREVDDEVVAARRALRRHPGGDHGRVWRPGDPAGRRRHRRRRRPGRPLPALPGRGRGRADPAAITLFENGGGGHLDLMAAQFLWRRYLEAG